MKISTNILLFILAICFPAFCFSVTHLILSSLEEISMLWYTTGIVLSILLGYIGFYFLLNCLKNHEK